VPTKIEKDAVTGRETTGHEWDGIRELDTPTPKWWLYVFLASIVWGLGMFVLYPAIPYGWGHTKGLLGYSARAKVDADVAKLVDQRKVAMDKIGAMPFDAIKADPALMEVALTSGRITFAENCQPCHGAGGGGNPGYPALAAGRGSGAARWKIFSRRSLTASAAPIRIRALARCRGSGRTGR
jgi:cytochrome c oxidase cbb3-type subunit III